LTVIAIVNRKGGSGKSTLAMHVAAWLARRGERVMLGDVDRQQSAVPWLKRRQSHSFPGAPLVGWALDPSNVLRPPAGVKHVVLDTPGALQGFKLSRLVVNADIVLMPLCESIFDRESAASCLSEIRMHPRVSGGRTQLALVGMRVDSGAHGERLLRSWAAERGVPLLGVLREARPYVRCAERGLTIFDLQPTKVAPLLEQWQPVLDWLAARLEAQAALAAPVRPSAILPPIEHPAITGAPAVSPVRDTTPVLGASALIAPEASRASAGSGGPAGAAVSSGSAPAQAAIPDFPAVPGVLSVTSAVFPTLAAAPADDVAAGPPTEAGPATVFPGDLMRPLVPPPRLAGLKRLVNWLVPRPLLRRVRSRS
jgi:chromosome partitioning protein